MPEKTFEGKITFIHHEKNRAVLEYLEKDKLKTIQIGLDDKKKPNPLTAARPHRYLIGDTVRFTLSQMNGKISAGNIRYLYNNSLSKLIHQAEEVNKFAGYVKLADNRYFIKEIESYLFFPLHIGAFEIPPVETDTDKPVFFKLEQLHNPEKITAVLYNHEYLPGFLKAIQHHKKQIVTEATVTKISIKVKLPVDAWMNIAISEGTLKEGSQISVMITHLNSDRIVTKRIENPIHNTDESSNIPVPR
jgi:hypothetical protein